MKAKKLLSLFYKNYRNGYGSLRLIRRWITHEKAKFDFPKDIDGFIYTIVYAAENNYLHDPYATLIKTHMRGEITVSIPYNRTIHFYRVHVQNL